MRSIIDDSTQGAVAGCSLPDPRVLSHAMPCPHLADMQGGRSAGSQSIGTVGGDARMSVG